VLQRMTSKSLIFVWPPPEADDYGDLVRDGVRYGED